jgi:hypothetical protein
MREARSRRGGRLVEALEQAHAEGQGVWTVTLITRAGVGELLGRALNGEPDALQLAPMIGETVRQITAHAKPSRRTSPLCLLCDTLFWRRELPEVIAILHAHRDDPTNAIISGICLSCCGAHQDAGALKDAVVASYRCRLQMDDLRELPPLGAPGLA